MQINSSKINNNNNNRTIHVIKRDGSKQLVNNVEITERLKKLSGDEFQVDVDLIVKKVIESIFDGVKTSQLDECASEICESLSIYHHDYSRFAGKIAFSNLQKETCDSFYDCMKKLYELKHPILGTDYPLVNDKLMTLVEKYHYVLQPEIDYSRDLNYNYSSFRAMTKTYLLSQINPFTSEKKIIERPQHMWMRVALWIHQDDIESVKKAYHHMSQGFYTHATPTLCQSGTTNPQLSSCFLLDVKDDIVHILDTFKNIGLISRLGGGIGINIHFIRNCGALIHGTNGQSNGIYPMLKCVESILKYIDQGGAKRSGAAAIYIEPWHPEIEQFINLRSVNLPENLTARNLFIGLWICDLFMKRVQEDGEWSLISPVYAPELPLLYGEEFEKRYIDIEKNYPQYVYKKIKAKDLYYSIIKTIIETGVLYILFKDQVNRCSNQKNVGTILSSNLCTEIVQYTSPEEIAVCNLASIVLDRLVDVKTKTFDFNKLKSIVHDIVEAQNKIIDITLYPCDEAKNSNLRHRPMGIGVQGLAQTFKLLKYSWSSEEAAVLNYNIFETIYHSALEKSCEIAKKLGKTYQTYEGSPISNGQFHQDMFLESIGKKEHYHPLIWDWEPLRKDIKLYGVYNSLFVAPMPTAGTSQLFGSSEGIDPILSNVFYRRVSAGEFVVVSSTLIEDLQKLGLWSDKMRQRILYEKGSIQNIDEIPDDIKEVHETAWEIDGNDILRLAYERSVFIDQSTSLNCFMPDPTFNAVSTWIMLGWKNGLKTGLYYLRRRPKIDQVFTNIDPTMIVDQFKEQNETMKNEQQKKRKTNEDNEERQVKKPKYECNPEDNECKMCSS